MSVVWSNTKRLNPGSTLEDDGATLRFFIGQFPNVFYGSGALGVSIPSAEKRYVEIQNTDQANIVDYQYTRIGMASDEVIDWTVTGMNLGDQANTWAMDLTGDIIVGGAVVKSNPTWAAVIDDRIGIGYIPATGEAFMYRNGTFLGRVEDAGGSPVILPWTSVAAWGACDIENLHSSRFRVVQAADADIPVGFTYADGTPGPEVARAPINTDAAQSRSTFIDVKQIGRQ